MGVIYKITSPSGKIYVGKTYDLRKRIIAHRHCARKGQNLILHNSIRKYGWEAHQLEVIEEIADDLLNEREMFWISELKTYCYENDNGMNMTKGGDGQRSTWMHDLERRKYMSEIFKGEKGPFYGRKHTEEWKINKSKEKKEFNLLNGVNIPEWGAEKGRQKIRKSVVAYNSNGDFVGEYISITEAANKLGLKLGSAKDSVIYGSWINGEYLIKYKTENYPLKIEIADIKMKAVKRPVLTLTPDYEVVCEHPSAQEASDFWGIPKTTINRAAMYNWLVPIRTGHVFIYTDLYEGILKNAS